MATPTGTPHAAGKTDTLELNQWSFQDKPTMEAFNYDNETIDEFAAQTRAALNDRYTKAQMNTSLGNKADLSYVNTHLANKAHKYLRDVDRIELGQDISATDSFIDFHTHGSLSAKDYDARIHCYSTHADGSTGGAVMRFYARFIELYARFSSAVLPYTSGEPSLGSATYKWNQLYAANGTINTSDAREKEEIVPLDSETMLRFLRALNPVSYRYISGTSGRPHYGLVAQEVEAAMRDCGIEDFAGLIKSPVVDDDGNETGDVTYGLRYNEFIALLIKTAQAQDLRLAAVEARLNAAGL